MSEDVRVLMDVCRLTESFMNDYPLAQYPELMYKAGRPYNCLLVDIHVDDYFIFIPYRTHIRHDNAFKFKGTERSKHNESGLDYTKIVLIRKYNYATVQNTVIDQDEYNETRKHIQRIADEAVWYIDGYVKHHNGTKVLHHREYDRRYKYSTLRYFHDLLGLQ